MKRHVITLGFLCSLIQVFAQNPVNTNQLVPFYDETTKLVGVKNQSTQEWFIKPKYTSIYNFYKGVALVYNIDKNGKFKYGYVDSTFKEIIEPIYDEVYSFDYQDFTYVKKDGLYAFVSITGEFFTQLKYDSIYFNGGDLSFCHVWMNNKMGILDQKGKELFPVKYRRVFRQEKDCILLYDENKCVFAKDDGTLFGDFIFEDIGPFSEGLAPVMQNSRWGYVNRAMEFVIAPQYDHARTFTKELAPVQKKGKWGFIDKNNKVKIPFKYDEVGTEHNNIWPVRKKNEWFFINPKGKKVSGIGSCYRDFYLKQNL